jgi:hypothetical protein
MSENRASRRYNLIHAYREPGSPRQNHLTKDQVKSIMLSKRKVATPVSFKGTSPTVVPKPKLAVPPKQNLINRIFGQRKTP